MIEWLEMLVSFFDDIGRIEGRQILCYAARVIELAKECSGEDFEPEFLEILSQARSNTQEMGDGARIYKTAVEAAKSF
jgi:hypothetical protein